MSKPLNMRNSPFSFFAALSERCSPSSELPELEETDSLKLSSLTEEKGFLFFCNFLLSGLTQTKDFFLFCNFLSFTFISLQFLLLFYKLVYLYTFSTITNYNTHCNGQWCSCSHQVVQDRPFSHHQQGRIDFSTVNPSLYNLNYDVSFKVHNIILLISR